MTDPAADHDGEIEQCDNPKHDAPADYRVTVHYPQGDVSGALCKRHSDADVVTREEEINAE